MRGSIKSGWRATAFSLGLVLALISPVFGQRKVVHHYMEDDKIPWGPSGTIGRGADDPPNVWEVPEPPSRPAVPAWPYLTTRSYEPGDGYRYPLYYNPTTRAYYYYPMVR